MSLAQNDQYRRLNKTLAEKFEWFYNRFPYSALIIDKELRHYVAGNHDTFLENVRKYGKAPQMRAIIKRFCVVTPGWQGWKGWEKKVYISLPNFSHLQTECVSELKSRRIQPVVGYSPKQHSWLSVAIGEASTLAFRATLSPAFGQLFDRIGRYGLTATISDKSYMAVIEKQIRGTIINLSNYLTSRGFVSIINQAEWGPGPASLRKAAEIAEIPYHVIAHGYIQDPKLISIAPIRSTSLSVWSPLQKREVMACIPKRDGQRVKYSGLPLDKKCGKFESVFDVLFILEPLGVLNSADSRKRASKIALASLAQKGLSTRVRVHQKDLARKDLCEMLELLGVDWADISQGNIARDLLETRVVIGTNSSVLFEAAALGISSFQILEGAYSTFEGVKQIKLSEISRVSLFAVEAGDVWRHMSDRVAHVIDDFLQ